MLLLARARGESDGAAIKGRNAILDPRLANGLSPSRVCQQWVSLPFLFFSFLFPRRWIGEYSRRSWQSIGAPSRNALAIMYALRRAATSFVWPKRSRDIRWRTCDLESDRELIGNREERSPIDLRIAQIGDSSGGLNRSCRAK
jgi:hypothetical protein